MAGAYCTPSLARIPCRGKLGMQQIHLITQDAAGVAEREIFRKVRSVWQSQELHPTLFQGPIVLVMVAPSASGDTVEPSILAAPGFGHNVISRKFGSWEALAAVQARIVITHEQGTIAKPGLIAIAVPRFPSAGDYAMNG